ncbi:MAG TPA: TetR family transcriptional regulator [Solirubrobacterales bacterium]|jgi:AcrR family transcriptional regulator|nr:TetR family transcriptional regulator [Solirubrobacterales bacterium]
MSATTPKQKSRRRLTPEARRALIDEAATEVFAQRGYEAATMQEIAAAAGVVASVVYLHYRSKEELYLELLERHSRALRERTIRSPRSSDIRGEFRRQIDDFFSALESNSFFWRTMFRDPPLDPKIAAAHARVHAKAGAAITQVLEGGADKKRRDGSAVNSSTTSMVAEMARTGLNGLACWWWDHREVERAAVVDTATALLWDGLGKMLRR